MTDPKNNKNLQSTEDSFGKTIPADSSHIGSADAFEETENPLSRDADNISDEKLDELLGD